MSPRQQHPPSPVNPTPQEANQPSSQPEPETAEQIADYLAFPGGYEGNLDDHERMQLLRQLHNAKPTTENREAADDLAEVDPENGAPVKRVPDGSGGFFIITGAVNA